MGKIWDKTFVIQCNPRKYRISRFFRGSGAARMESNFVCSVFTQFPQTTFPRKEASIFMKEHFSGEYEVQGVLFDRAYSSGTSHDLWNSLIPLNNRPYNFERKLMD